MGEIAKLLNRILDWFRPKSPKSILWRHRQSREKALKEGDTSALEDDLDELLSYRRVCERTACAHLPFGA